MHKSGVLDEALILFNKMPQRDVVSWTAIIAGCAQNGHAEKALEIYKQMQLAGDTSETHQPLSASSQLVPNLEFWNR
ncbi:hypothetical protein KI387_040811, partial [Taxus chinensis]